MRAGRQPARIVLIDDCILICFDGSVEARRAIDAVAAIFPGASAIVLDVAATLDSDARYASVAAAAMDFDELNEEDARRHAREGAAYACRAGLRATPYGVLAADTWRGVVDVVEGVDAALIVVGSRGLSGVRVWVEGSLSHELLRHVRRPLLVVPPPRDA